MEEVDQSELVRDKIIDKVIVSSSVTITIESNKDV